MVLRSLMLAFGLALAPLGLAPALVAPAALAQAPMDSEELLYATGLDAIFAHYGAGIVQSTDETGLPLPESFTRAWSAAAAAVFEPDQMHARLAALLDGQFGADELAALGSFFRSDFGQRIIEIERAVVLMDPDLQLATRDEGIALLEEMTPAAPRQGQIEEMMTLVGAEIGRTMVTESMRAMVAAMHAGGQQGDIEVPWDEIDAQLAQIMPGVWAEVEASQRALSAYAYRELTDAELERYLQFLRGPAAQKLYRVAGLAIADVVTGAMARFGEELASRLQRVDI